MLMPVLVTLVNLEAGWGSRTMMESLIGAGPRSRKISFLMAKPNFS